MTRTEFARPAGSRPVSADLLLCAIGACFAVAVQAADVPVAVAPPKPVVIQPTATMAPPPPLPQAAEAAAQPVAKGGKAKKTATRHAKPVKTVAKQKTAKPASKPKANAKKR